MLRNASHVRPLNHSRLAGGIIVFVMGRWDLLGSLLRALPGMLLFYT